MRGVRAKQVLPVTPSAFIQMRSGATARTATEVLVKTGFLIAPFVVTKFLVTTVGYKQQTTVIILNLKAALDTAPVTGFS